MSDEKVFTRLYLDKTLERRKELRRKARRYKRFEVFFQNTNKSLANFCLVLGSVIGVIFAAKLVEWNMPSEAVSFANALRVWSSMTMLIPLMAYSAYAIGDEIIITLTQKFRKKAETTWQEVYDLEEIERQRKSDAWIDMINQAIKM